MLSTTTKQQIAKFLFRIASKLVRNDDRFIRDFKVHLNAEITSVSVCETGDHLRRDLQPLSTFTTEMIVYELSRKKWNKHGQSWPKYDNKYYLEEWLPSSEPEKDDDMSGTDKFGNEFDIGDIVYFPSSGIMEEGTVHETGWRGVVKIKTKSGYTKMKNKSVLINKTKTLKIIAEVFPERFI